MAIESELPDMIPPASESNSRFPFLAELAINYEVKKDVPAIENVIPLTQDNKPAGFLLSNETGVVMITHQSDSEKVTMIDISPSMGVRVFTLKRDPFDSWFHKYVAPQRGFFMQHIPASDAIAVLRTLMKYYHTCSLLLGFDDHVSIIESMQSMVDTALSQFSEVNHQERKKSPKLGNPLVLTELQETLAEARKRLSRETTGDADSYPEHEWLLRQNYPPKDTHPLDPGDEDTLEEAIPPRDTQDRLDPGDEFPVENVLLHAIDGLQKLTRKQIKILFKDDTLTLLPKEVKKRREMKVKEEPNMFDIQDFNSIQISPLGPNGLEIFIKSPWGWVTLHHNNPEDNDFIYISPENPDRNRKSTSYVLGQDKTYTALSQLLTTMNTIIANQRGRKARKLKDLLKRYENFKHQ